MPQGRQHSSTIDLSINSGDAGVAPRATRSQMMHRRKMDNCFTALQRSAAVDGGGGRHALTPEAYSSLHPTYTSSERFATRTSSELIGLGNDALGIGASRHLFYLSFRAIRTVLLTTIAPLQICKRQHDKADVRNHAQQSGPIACRGAEA